MKPEQWILSRDVGTSSRTIWAVMTGLVDFYVDDSMTFDVPHDIDDLGRCLRMLNLFPEWKGQLQKVADIFPKWKPYVREWRELEELYINYYSAEAFYEVERLKHPRRAKREWQETTHRIFQFIHSLEEEGLRCDGWVQTGLGSWEKNHLEGVA